MLLQELPRAVGVAGARQNVDAQDARQPRLVLAADLGLEAGERRLTRDDVYLADEAFFTGTAAEIVPIVELDRRAIGTGAPGPITGRLREAYAAAVHGRDPRHRDWLASVGQDAKGSAVHQGAA